MVEDRASGQPVVNVVGERVALGPLRRDLLPAYQRWANDLAVAHRFGAPPEPVTLDQIATWSTARLPRRIDTHSRFTSAQPDGRSARVTSMR